MQAWRKDKSDTGPDKLVDPDEMVEFWMDFWEKHKDDGAEVSA